LYEEYEKWHNLLFDCATIFVRKEVSLPISVILLLEAKSLQENGCFNKFSAIQTQNVSSMMHNHKSQHGTHVQQTLLQLK
jgi:hypothetical protein